MITQAGASIGAGETAGDPAAAAPRADAARSAVKDLRIGVIGFGARGGLARHTDKPGGGSCVTVVADPNPAAKERVDRILGEGIENVPSI